MRRALRSLGLLPMAIMLAGSTLASSAGAQSDHLKCYKVKDPAAKVSYTADLTGLVRETGCVIKVPAVLACVPATKRNVRPPAGEGGGSTLVSAYGCYKVKCPSATLPALVLNDQFGNRTVTPSAPKLICAPAAPPVFPPCSTAAQSCGSCTPAPNAENGLCLPLCADGCGLVCSSVVPTAGCQADADCPFGQKCLGTVVPECSLGCSNAQGNCGVPCP
jgi:hypothetical protein